MSSIIPPILPLLGAAVLFGLATVLRLSFYVGVLERPISIAILWGIFTGDWALVLCLGVFFELFWMDLIGAGTYIPPNANLPLLLCLFVVHAFAGQGFFIPDPPLVLIVLAVPLAYIGSGFEQRHRKKLISIHEQLVEERQMDKAIPTAVIFSAMGRLLFKESLLFILLGLLIYLLFVLLIHVFGSFPGPVNLSWAVLWMTALLGGLLSLRTRRAVISLSITLGIFCILLLQG